MSTTLLHTVLTAIFKGTRVNWTLLRFYSFTCSEPMYPLGTLSIINK